MLLGRTNADTTKSDIYFLLAPYMYTYKYSFREVKKIQKIASGEKTAYDSHDVYCDHRNNTYCFDRACAFLVIIMHTERELLWNKFVLQL